MALIERREADGVIVFNHLAEAGDRVGETRKIEAVTPSEAVERSNRKGTLRTVESFMEAGALGTTAAEGVLAAFADK